MLRLGLCCQFADQPIKFFTTTATSILKMTKSEARLKLSRLCLANAVSLGQALEYCGTHHIGCFRVNSQILPLKTHPQAGYDILDLPDGKAIIKAFEQCKAVALKHNVRTVFHPDQFVLLSSPNHEVTERSIADLDYQAEVSEWIGADSINIHGGGAYGDKSKALEQVAANMKLLPQRVKSRLTLENDDKIYTPADLLPICHQHKLGFVYDVHHHRCHPDDLSIEEATQQALATWKREPLFHISSPKDGWNGARPNEHHDYIDAADFPDCWQKLNITVEVEAKAKELAVLRLLDQIGQPS